MSLKTRSIFYILYSLFPIALHAQEDPFCTKAYWRLNQTPMQERLRQLKPFPVSVVYYQQQTERTLPAIGRVFDQIKAEGFTGLKQISLHDPAMPKGFTEQVFNLALDKGLSPWFYGTGGWEPLSADLLKRLNLKGPVTDQNLAALEADPKMVAYQTARLRERIARMASVPKPPLHQAMGEPGRSSPWLPERLVAPFANWLQQTYPSVDSLNRAWNVGWTGGESFATHQEAAKHMQGKAFDEYGRGTGALVWEIRRYRDALRFQADLAGVDFGLAVDHYLKLEPNEPRRLGAHQLLENQALNGWDMEAEGRAAAKGGSFYASIHLAHHFFLVDNEVTRPAYIQARILADNCKGGWPAIWEGTGGPTQWSGYESFTVDSLTIGRLIAGYVACGIKGLGFWTYNSRDAGWELGEYALTDLQGRPTGRSRMAGAWARALDKHRVELWQALDEPAVGILYSWENEATLARMALGGYPLATRAYPHDRAASLGQMYAEARIGVSRTLMDANVPFEYCSERDLAEGLATRYKTIYLPCMATLPEATQRRLEAYVRAGGHLVAEMPLLLSDEYGRLNKWAPTSTAARLFGLQVTDYQNFFNAPGRIGADTLEGQLAVLSPLPGGARITQRHPDGRPLVAEHTLGQGRITVLNLEAARQVRRPGHPALQAWLAGHIVGGQPLPFSVQGHTMIFRRVAPGGAAHYFCLNDGPAEQAILSPTRPISKAQDALTGQPLEPKAGRLTLDMPAGSARWVRVE